MNTAPVSAASIVDRLVRYSKAHVVDHSFVLVRYGIERLLWRLASSRHADEFVLKGANLFAVWCDDQLRPTRDLDLLGSGEPDPERFAGIFRELCAMDTVAIDALVELGILNSRLKDYHDMAVMLESTVLDPERLVDAIEATFRRRRTPLPIDVPYGLSEAFRNEPAKQRLWATFKGRSGVHNERSLPEQVDFLRERLMPVLRSVQGRAAGETKA